MENPIQQNENSPKLLSFEEFSSSPDGRRPLSNNFFFQFTMEDNHLIQMYKSMPHYVRFAEANAALNEKICKEIQSVSIEKLRNEPVSQLAPYMKDLYEAYKIMRGYGMTDEELFA